MWQEIPKKLARGAESGCFWGGGDWKEDIQSCCFS